jgi:hypothetical protein
MRVFKPPVAVHHQQARGVLRLGRPQRDQRFG